MAPPQGLLPLFWVQLRGSLALLFLGGSLCLLAVLGPAMWHMWIYLGSANANFYYAATLLFGAWQVRCSFARRHVGWDWDFSRFGNSQSFKALSFAPGSRAARKGTAFSSWQ